MRAKNLLKSLFFALIIGFFAIPNTVEGLDLQNTCEYTYVSTARDGSSKTSKIGINMYGSGTTVERMNATIYSLYDDENFEEDTRYKIDNWNQSYDFYFNFPVPDFTDDYFLDTDDFFQNVDTVISNGGTTYLGRTISFPAYVTDVNVNNFDFSKCPKYVYVADIWQAEDPDINIFISDNDRDTNGNSYKDLFTVYTISFEEHPHIGVNDYASKSNYIQYLKDQNQSCPYDGPITWNSNTADYKFCIFNPHVSGGTNNKVSYFSDDGSATNFNYAAVAADDVINHYDEVQARKEQTSSMGQEIGCENLFTMEEGSVGWILQRILNYIKIFGPILVILLSAIDFIKAIMSSDEKLMQSVQSKFIIRLIATIALFLIPFIVQLILNIFLGISNPTCGIQ